MRFGKYPRTLEVVLGYTLSLLHPTPTKTQLNTIISLLGINPREMQTCPHKDLHMNIQMLYS